MNLFKFDKEDQIHYISEIISLFNSEGCELMLYATKSEIANVAGKGVSNVHIDNKPVTLIEEYPESLDHEGHYSESIWVEEATWNPTEEMLLQTMKSMESFCIFKTESVKKTEGVKAEVGKYYISNQAKELMSQAIAAGMKVEITPKGLEQQGGKILDGFFEMIGEALTGHKAVI